MNSSPASRIACVAVLFAGTFTVTSCSVSYDSVADQDINAITNEVDQQFQIWALQAADGKPVVYDDDTMKAYGKIEGDLAALSVRLSSSPDMPTQNMSARAQNLRSQIDKVRALHAKEGAISAPQFFIAEEKLIDPQLAVLNAYEAALKSGASTGAASSDASQRAAAKSTK